MSACTNIHPLACSFPCPWLLHSHCWMSQAKLEWVGNFSFLLPKNVRAAVKDVASRVMTPFYCKSQLGIRLPCLKQLWSYYTSSGLSQAVFLAEGGCLCSAWSWIQSCAPSTPVRSGFSGDPNSLWILMESSQCMVRSLPVTHHLLTGICAQLQSDTQAE